MARPYFTMQNSANRGAIFGIKYRLHFVNVFKNNSIFHNFFCYFVQHFESRIFDNHLLSARVSQINFDRYRCIIVDLFVVYILCFCGFI